MSESVIENVKQVAVKKKWKVKIVLFPLLFFAFANIYAECFADALIFSLWGFPFYWVWEKAKKSSNDNNESSWRHATDDRNMFDDRPDYNSIFDRQTPNYGLPGFDYSGNYTGSDTAIGGISN